MPVTEKSELIFITAMMILIIILCIAAVYIFFRTYKKEMRDKELRKQAQARNAGSVSEEDSKSTEGSRKFTH